MNRTEKINDVFHAIDFASIDASDENPLAVAMIFTPAKGWTFCASHKTSDLEKICGVFPLLASMQGIWPDSKSMTIERAKQIVSDMVSVFLCTQGINGQHECKNIDDYSLQEMLDANEMLNGYSEKTEKGRNTFMHFHPRGTAALYAWAHHPVCSSDEDESIEPIVHAQGRALILIKAEKNEDEREI